MKSLTPVATLPEPSYPARRVRRPRSLGRVVAATAASAVLLIGAAVGCGGAARTAGTPPEPVDEARMPGEAPATTDDQGDEKPWKPDLSWATSLWEGVDALAPKPEPVAIPDDTIRFAGAARPADLRVR